DKVPITMIPRPNATCKCAPSHRVCDESRRMVACGGGTASPLDISCHIWQHFRIGECSGRQPQTVKSNNQKDAAHFLDQSGTEGIREVPGRSQVDLSNRLDDRCRGGNVRYCE